MKQGKIKCCQIVKHEMSKNNGSSVKDWGSWCYRVTLNRYHAVERQCQQGTLELGFASQLSLRPVWMRTRNNDSYEAPPHVLSKENTPLHCTSGRQK
jgi:hypothetical protein